MTKSKNSPLINRLRAGANDECYTRVEDIERNLRPFIGNLRGKRIYLPFDTERSNFFRYLVANANEIGFASVTATHLENNHALVFKPKSAPHRFGIESGDFFGDACQSILRDSDVVITNPPFSLIGEFVTCAMNAGKSMFFLGPLTTGLRGFCFDHYKAGRLFPVAGKETRRFETPDGSFMETPCRFWTTWPTPQSDDGAIKFDVPAGGCQKYDGTDVYYPKSFRHIPVDAKFVAFSCSAVATVHASGLFKPVELIRGTINGRPMFGRVVFERV